MYLATQAKMNLSHLNLAVINSFLLSLSFAIDFKLNSTGGTFPDSVYQETVFSYEFVNKIDESMVTYAALGSSAGKCNIMGYWSTANTNFFLSQQTKTRDTLICTDQCNSPSSISICGNSSILFPRFDSGIRKPLINFAGSDSVLGNADYNAFPDLQMFPSLAGAVVPIYNIPDLNGHVLALSRGTMAGIFLGNIKQWNDPKVLADNADAQVRQILSGLNQMINVVVRTDSSGTTEIFSTALYLFDPPGAKSPDNSFGASAGKGSTPRWCEPLTDEVQIIAIRNCESSYPSAQKQVTMLLVGTDFVVRSISVSCDATATAMKAAFETVYGAGSILVTRSLPDNTGSSYAFTIGYWGSKLTTKNWYQPAVLSTISPVTASVTTLQEGGYLNSHYNSSYVITSEMQSIWINMAANNNSFNLTNPNSAYPSTMSTTINPSAPNLLATIKAALQQVAPALVSTVKQITHSPSTWVEFQVTFNMSQPNPRQPKALVAHMVSALGLGSVAVTRYLTGYNYPVFYDSTHPLGYSGSGKYTCYKHMQNLTAWSYYTGSGNKGVIAEVSVRI